MSDDQKIWFIYLTDHHEGPFTPGEVAEKISEGAVTPQSLGWKDGMPEWLPIETIPELSAALGGGAPAAGGDDNFSLAQMLATQQGGEAAPADAATGATSVMNMGQADGGFGSAGGAEPGPLEEVWTLRVGDHVSGLFSLQELKRKASEGEVPAGSMLWHSGWSDFQPLSSVPELAAVKATKKAAAPAGKLPARAAVGAGGTNTALNRPKGFAPLTATADVGSDDRTDPGIGAPKQGLLDKIKGMFGKKKAAAHKPFPTNKFAAKSSAGGGLVKRAGTILGIVLVVVGAAAGYFFLFSSPIPSDLDVTPDDLEMMREVVKMPKGQGKLYLALAHGSEENPADDSAPTFYVATNLPEGANITMNVVGHPGTLVNRVAFEGHYTASVKSKHMAVFERVQDDGKPLPMGEYTINLASEGAEPLTKERFMGGKKGGIYNDRLKKYKDKMQGEYDKEMQSLREYIDTLKSLQAEISKRVHDYKTTPAGPVRMKIANEWRLFSGNALALIQQLETKVKAQTTAGGQIYHPRAFQDVLTTLGQMRQLVALHTERSANAPPTGNADDVEGLVQAGVISLDQWFAQALVKSPLDALSSAPPAAPPAAAPVPAAAPATVPAKR